MPSFFMASALALSASPAVSNVPALMYLRPTLYRASYRPEGRWRTPVGSPSPFFGVAA